MEAPSLSPDVQPEGSRPIDFEAFISSLPDEWPSAEWAPGNSRTPNSSVAPFYQAPFYYEAQNSHPQDFGLSFINLGPYSYIDDASGQLRDGAIQDLSNHSPNYHARNLSVGDVTLAESSTMNPSTIKNLSNTWAMGSTSPTPHHGDWVQANISVVTPPESSLGTFESSSTDGRSEVSAAFAINKGDETSNLHQMLNPEHLAKLSPSFLKEISGKIAQALVVAETREPQGFPRGVKEATSSPPATRAVQGAAGRPKYIKTVYRCEHPGCTVTFQRKKDGRRHLRNKHQANEGFPCPIIDCPMGTGHRILRSDKLRDHLRGKISLTFTWSCVMPGCTVTTSGRSDMLDHVGKHTYASRLSNRGLLIDYGFAPSEIRNVISVEASGRGRNNPSQNPLGYITRTHVCTVYGCPFGTNSTEDFRIHQALPHEGAHCPCPIRGCEEIFRDWESAYSHVLRNHSEDSREACRSNLANQGFQSALHVFICPICKSEIKYGYRMTLDNRVRLHCQTHDYLEMLAARKELVAAWIFSNGRPLIWFSRIQLDSPTDREIFVFMALPDSALKRVKSREHLNQTCLENM